MVSHPVYPYLRESSYGNIGTDYSPSRTKCASLSTSADPIVICPCFQSSSFLGPLIVGLIADATGNIRYAFFFLVFMIWLAVPILMSVDVEKGRNDARAYRYQATGE